MFAKTLTILLLLSFTLCYPTFDEFVVQFGKNYSSEEYEIRKNIYEQRV